MKFIAIPGYKNRFCILESLTSSDVTKCILLINAQIYKI